jgi:hypothetical protein
MKRVECKDVKVYITKLIKPAVLPDLKLFDGTSINSFDCNVFLCHRRVEKNDEGVYVCRASNEGGHNDGLMWLLIQSEFSVTKLMFYSR